MGPWGLGHFSFGRGGGGAGGLGVLGFGDVRNSWDLVRVFNLFLFFSFFLRGGGVLWKDTLIPNRGPNTQVEDCGEDCSRCAAFESLKASSGARKAQSAGKGHVRFHSRLGQFLTFGGSDSDFKLQSLTHSGTAETQDALFCTQR